MTPEKLLRKMTAINQRTDALREYWTTFVYEDAVPSDRQFHIWINRYGFDVVTESMEAMVERLQQWLDDPGKPIDLDRLIKYVSGIAKKKSQPGSSRAYTNHPPTGGKTFEIEEGEAGTAFKVDESDM